MDVYKDILEKLEWQHQRLRFKSFSFDQAHIIGQYLVKAAKDRGLAVTIDIMYKGQQLYHIALEGTTDDNDHWVKRKNRVVNYFKMSSYYMSILLKSEGKTIEEKYELDSKDYAAFGGAYPIMLEDNTCVGTITVSGLPDHEDHRLVVEAIEWYLK